MSSVSDWRVLHPCSNANAFIELCQMCFEGVYNCDKASAKEVNVCGKEVIVVHKVATTRRTIAINSITINRSIGDFRCPSLVYGWIKSLRMSMLDGRIDEVCGFGDNLGNDTEV